MFVHMYVCYKYVCVHMHAVFLCAFVCMINIKVCRKAVSLMQKSYISFTILATLEYYIACMYMYMSVNTYACIYVRIYAYMYLNMLKCMYIYAFRYVCM